MFSFLCKSCQNQRLLQSVKHVTPIRSKRYVSELRRFYKQVTIAEGAGGYEVNLDRKKLKTPLGKLFLVPNEAIALAVAAEWDSQHDVIRRQGMHLTSLCNTALDNPTHRDRETTIDSILEFLETDTVLYQSLEPPKLHELQAARWQPLIGYVNHRFEIDLKPTMGIAVPGVSNAALEAYRTYLNSFDKWALVGFTQCVENLKSLIITTCLLNRKILVEDAVYLSRLESEYQTSEWGAVEWHHDIEKLDLSARVAAATLFVHMNIEDDRTFSRKTNFSLK